MTTEEMQDLDLWIVDHIMGHPERALFFPTEDAKDAIEVLKKCCERTMVTISTWQGTWSVGSRETLAKDSRIELAICQFARKLFSQPAA